MLTATQDGIQAETVCCRTFTGFVRSTAIQWLNGCRYENFTVDSNEEGKVRSDFESLIDLMDRCDRVWTPELGRCAILGGFVQDYGELVHIFISD